MIIYILEIMNYTGKSGFSRAWSSRFYLEEEGEPLAQVCLQTPGALGPRWDHSLCPSDAEEGEKMGTGGSPG